jgi:hypothetical protein
VQNGDKLRHRSHLHARSYKSADDRARNQNGDQQNVIAIFNRESRRDEREQHSQNPV